MRLCIPFPYFATSHHSNNAQLQNRSEKIDRSLASWDTYKTKSQVMSLFLFLMDSSCSHFCNTSTVKTYGAALRTIWGVLLSEFQLFSYSENFVN